MTVKRFWKSTLPRSNPIGGIIMSFTNELTIGLKAAPMMIPDSHIYHAASHDKSLEVLHLILLYSAFV